MKEKTKPAEAIIETPIEQNIFVKVNSITGLVGDLEYIGNDALMQIPLNATVLPRNATNQNIVWTLVEGSATIVNGNVLIISSIGTFKVKATIANALGDGSDYEQVFTINVGDGSGTEVLVEYNGGIMQIPLNATTNAPSDKSIVWELLEGTAIILDNSDILIVSSLGIFKTKATIINGLGEGFNYDKIYIINVVESLTPIGNNKNRDKKHGILLAGGIVSQEAKIKVITLEQAQINLAVYDNLGNVIFEKSGVRNDKEILWNLTNSAGRNVANGSYLIIAEVKGVSGKVYRYSAKVGVKR